jgi:hypothetical protein
MKLPYSEQAFVDIRKLSDYCLNPDHPRGRHKARVFASTLGLTADHAEELREAILEAVLTNDAQPDTEDEYGQRYIVDFVMHRSENDAAIRTSWIIRRDEDFPRLTSCYVLV